MDSDQIRSTFTDFFGRRGHVLVPDHGLLPPEGDDSVLFTTSGMHHLTPYLLGRRHPGGRRLVGSQRCLRTTDLAEVGDGTHLTTFEMLGSWSLGDYDHPRSLRWGHELLLDGFGLDPSHLHTTVFGGDGQVGPDEESLRVWEDLGVPVEPLAEDNWWSNGPTGPCGPDSEVFAWTGSGRPTGTPSTDDRWVEVWNHVSMRYQRYGDGRLEPLEQRSVDTGMGLERIAMVLQGATSVFGTDLLLPWVRVTGDLWPHLGPTDRRVVVDHLRSVRRLVGDGVRPSNKGRGYVLRRLVRRVLTLLWEHGTGPTLGDLPPDLRCGPLLEEEQRFRSLVQRGRRVVAKHRGPLTEADLDVLHATHGLPRDLVQGLLSDAQAPST